MAKSVAKQFVHEVSSGQHRLVIIKGGIPSASPWFEHRQVGSFQGQYFHVGAAGGMPAVFRVSAVDHEVLA